MRICRSIAAAVAASLVAACTVNFSDLVAEFDETGVPLNAGQCTSTSPAPPQMLEAQFQTKQDIIPAKLQSSTVMQAVLAHAKYVKLATASAGARVANARLGLSAPASTPVATPASVAKPSITLTQADFVKFADLIVSYVFRNSGDATPGAGNTDPFVSRLSKYYQAYYAGNYVTYFGKKLTAPTVSLTISDDEIDQAATVLIELALDVTLQTPVWCQTSDTTANAKYCDIKKNTNPQGGKTAPNSGKGNGNNNNSTNNTTTTYYPGANSNKPTLLDFQNTAPLSETGCGINEQKATAIAYVSQKFATAAAADTGIAIKTPGGLEIGLGVLGKLSVGDNSTLTNLVQTVASEVVLRLTAQAAYEVLNQIDFGGPAGGGAPQAMMAARFGQTRPQHAATVQSMSALFIDPNGR